MLESLKYIEVPKPRKNFYASDFNKSNIDLYFSWTDEPKTNPPKWFDTLRWGAGNGVEEKMLEILKMNDIVPKDYDQKLHGGFKIEREGITVSGYTDARNHAGEPIEIKSINNKNSHDVKQYENGFPRENYVGQLAIYLDALGKDRGYLFASSVDGLHTFWFECVSLGGGTYQCGNVVVNVYAEYKRWATLYSENISKGVMPDPKQYIYKYDVREIDWKSLPASKIAAARKGRSVIGDWQITFSDWKDKIIELQGQVPGYTNEELEIILEKTKGYTTWNKKSPAKKAAKRAK